jgi:ELWxxDGT repeat protein
MAPIEGFPRPEPGDYLELKGSTGDELLVVHRTGFFRTDGSAAGLRRITSLDGMGIGDVKTLGGYAVVNAGSEQHTSLYVLAPGSTQATRLAAASPMMRVLGGALYFAQADGVYRWAPGEAVTKVGEGAPTAPWIPTYAGYDIAKAGDTLFWATPDAEYLRRLRTAAGPVPGPAHDPSVITPIGPGRVVFWAKDDREAPGTGEHLWAADASGMRRLTDVPNYPRPLNVTRAGIVFFDSSSAAGGELWRTDGTPAGTALVADINRRPLGSRPTGAARVGSRVVFGTWEDGSLWTTDGTEAGTAKLRANGTTGNWLSPWGLFSDGATAYFTGQDDWLYRTDGTPDGTRPIRGGIDRSSFSGLGRLGSAFLFNGNGELWRTDGTSAGTRSLQAPSAWFGAANDRTMLLTRLYGSARTDGATVTEESGLRDAVAVPGGFLSGRSDGLYTLDADGGNPRLATAIEYQQGLLRVGQRVLFIAGVPWRWHSADLSGRDITELDLVGGTVQWATTVGEHAYVVTAKDYDVYLYRTDGTNAGTVLLHRFEGVDSDRTPTGFSAFDGTVYFSAFDFEHGYELWRTDGTPQGTGIAADIVPGPGSSEPLDLVGTDDFLFFSAYSVEYGEEAWRVRRGAPPVPENPELPPVTIAPVLEPERAVAAPPGGYPVKVLRPSVTVQVKRLRAVRGVKRWRVTGQLQGTGCSGRVRVDLGRGDRRLKTVTARVTRCRFNVVLKTSSRSGRWIAVRAGAVRSRPVSVR